MGVALKEGLPLYSLDLVRTQTKNTQVQGHSTILHPPSGTGCQIHSKMQNELSFQWQVRFYLFLTPYSPTSLLTPLTISLRYLFPCSIQRNLPHSSLPSFPLLPLFFIIINKCNEHTAANMKCGCLHGVKLHYTSGQWHRHYVLTKQKFEQPACHRD